VLQRDTSNDNQIVEFHVETLFQNVRRIFSAVGSFLEANAEHRQALLEESDASVAQCCEVRIQM
jgi:hypothetical protein